MSEIHHDPLNPNMEAEMPQYPAITISRSLGSGGTEVGFLVSRLMGWHFCDRRILRLASEILGQSASSLAWQEERHSGFLEKLLTILSLGSPEAPYTPLLEIPIYSRELFAVESEVMFRMVRHAPSVILGRGGFVALKDRSATLHVSIHSDLAFRIQLLVERGKAPNQHAAREAIIASDRDRGAFIHDISGFDWHDPKHFHLVLDVSHGGIEASARQIVDDFAHRFGKEIEASDASTGKHPETQKFL